MPYTTMNVSELWNLERFTEDMILKGWMQADLAERAGVDGSSLSRFLAGQAGSPRFALKVASALGWPLKRYYIGNRKAA